jgi:hypothetical protein
MADTPISALPVATAVGLADLIVLVQSATTKQGTPILLLTQAGFRVKSDGSFQIWNPDQSKFHTLQVRGAAGAEYITIGLGEV